jgi:hypothetical protein
MTNRLTPRQLGVLYHALADLEQVKFWKGECTEEQMEDAIASLGEQYQDALIDSYEYESVEED